MCDTVPWRVGTWFPYKHTGASYSTIGVNRVLEPAELFYERTIEFPWRDLRQHTYKPPKLKLCFMVGRFCGSLARTIPLLFTSGTKSKRRTLAWWLVGFSMFWYINPGCSTLVFQKQEFPAYPSPRFTYSGEAWETKKCEQWLVSAGYTCMSVWLAFIKYSNIVVSRSCHPHTVNECEVACRFIGKFHISFHWVHNVYTISFWGVSDQLKFSRILCQVLFFSDSCKKSRQGLLLVRAGELNDKNIKYVHGKRLLALWRIFPSFGWRS